MSKRNTGVQATCVDPEDLQLLADGELAAVRVAAVHGHMAGCVLCGERFHELQQAARRFRLELGKEDDAEAERSAAAVRRVEAVLALRRGVRKKVPRWVSRSMAPAAAVAAAAIIWIWPTANVTAAPGVILDAATVRAGARIYEPGKVLHWTVASDIVGHPTLADGHYRTLQWVNNIACSEASVLRKVNDRDELVFAVWRRADGSEVVYRRGADTELVLHPPAAVVKGQLTGLAPVDRARVQRFLDRRGSDDDLMTRRNRFAEWFVSSTTARRAAVMRRIRTDEGRDAFYIRTESARPGGGDQVKRLVVETYIEAEGYRRYRQRSTREHDDGTWHTEDARWSPFTEVTEAAFAEQVLNDLTTRMTPLVFDAARIAQQENARQ